MMTTITVYGSHSCPGTIYALNTLSAKQVGIDYRDITGGMQILKEFLKIRDTEAMFDEVKKIGNVGIPLFIFEDGTRTLDLNEVLEKL